MKQYRIQDVDQNTPEWLELRRSFIGASDAPIIMEQSPWKTPLQLWEQKLGLASDESSTFAMKRGIELEPVARKAYNDYTSNYATPHVVFSEKTPFMMASLDGLSIDGSVAVEIKCPGKEDHEIAKSGKVPDKYYAQLQHQIETIGAEVVHYFSFRDGDFKLLEVERDQSFIDEMVSKEKEFWKKVSNFEAPELTSKDYKKMDNDEWISLADELKLIQLQKKQLEATEKQIRESLIEMSGGHSCEGGGIKLLKSFRKGNVDYSKIPELKSVDLDAYRKSPSLFWRVTT